MPADARIATVLDLQEQFPSSRLTNRNGSSVMSSKGNPVVVASKTKNAKATRVVFKTVFESPLQQWPVIEASVAKDILRAALDIVAHYGSHLKRSTIKRERNASKRFKTEHATPPSYIITGFNQVMNALEGGTLSLILACREDLANPQILHHLPFQCRLGGVTLASLPAGASEELQSLLDIPKISLVGFTNQDCKEPKDKEYMEFLNFVQKRVPKMTADLSEYQSLCVRKVPIVTGEKIGRKKDKSSKSPIPSKSSIAPKSSASSSTFSTTLKPPASSKSR